MPGKKVIFLILDCLEAADWLILFASVAQSPPPNSSLAVSSSSSSSGLSCDIKFVHIDQELHSRIPNRGVNFVRYLNKLVTCTIFSSRMREYFKSLHF